MNTSRMIILGVALVAGVGAFFLVQANTTTDVAERTVEPLREQTVRVLISSRDIQRGERITIEETNWISWPKKAVQPSFITDEDPEARDELTGAVARSLIVTGEPIVNAKLVKADSGGLMAAIIAPGYRAVTLRVSPETSSGGFILPGDEVDVMLTTDGRGRNRTRLLFQGVRVLAVNAIYSENSEAANIAGSNVTIELSPVDAESFITARSNGAVSLVLRSIFKPEGDVQADITRPSGVTVVRYGRS